MTAIINFGAVFIIILLYFRTKKLYILIPLLSFTVLAIQDIYDLSSYFNIMIIISGIWAFIMLYLSIKQNKKQINL